jgi:ParB family chromosome partitioning protein
MNKAAEIAEEEGEAEPEDSPETRELETRLRETLGTKVNLYRSRRGGRIVIHFFSEEELNAIYEAIVGEGAL